MKVLIVGGTGTIGKAVHHELSKRHDIIVASHKHSALKVDLSDKASIEQMYKQTGRLDAIVAAAGLVHFGLLSEMTSSQYEIGLQSKLMGQVNLVLMGLAHLNDGGSFTLTSGSASEDPFRYGSSPAMVNAAIDGFVKAAAIEMPRGIRINAVSPTILAETMKDYGQYFFGYIPVLASTAAIAYSKSVEGAQTGRIYRIG